MAYLIRRLIVTSAIAGALAVSAGAASLAQGPASAYGPRVHVTPYAYHGYAYSPASRGYSGAPPQYDTSGMAFSLRELGWQGGPPGSAPSNPCRIGQRMQNRC